MSALAHTEAFDALPELALDALDGFATRMAAVQAAGEQLLAGLARIDVLVVNEEDRRRGIGRMLLKSASQLARMAGCDVLEVVAGQCGGDGTSFLEATGFAGCGQLICRPLRRRGGSGE